MDQTSYNKLKRLLEPCQTADELDRYLREFLKLDLPWDTVDEDSSSSPLKFVWQVYKVMLTGKGPTRHVTAAARNSYKTVTGSLIQFLSLLHFRRDGAHIASILDQSTTAIRYLDNYMNIPELVPYRVTDNVRVKQFVNLPANDFTVKSDSILRVVTATKKGANSPRASTITLDEVDLTPREIIAEVAYVADPTRDQHKFDPLFIYLSSRKSNDGPIQDLINEAEDAQKNSDYDIKLHRWSSADMMEVCTPEVHKPELGPVEAFINTESLEIVWGKENFDKGIHSSIKAQFKEVSAFEGCKTCSAFIACQGRAPRQRGDSPGLRTRKFVGSVLKAVKDPGIIIAQTLNWRPESTALVFKTFSYFRHVKDQIDFYNWVTNGKFYQDLPESEVRRIENEGTLAEIGAITPSKEDIYAAMVEAGWTIGAGTDWGFNPDPAFAIVIGWHRKWKRCAVLHMDHALNHANHVWAQYIAETIYPRFPFEYIGPDMADPASPTYFAKYRIRSLDTKPSRIETGVSFIRGLLWSPVNQRSDFCILDDSQGDNQNRALVEAMLHWTHLKTATGGYNMEKFTDDKWTHPLDALRYVMAPFVEEMQISMASGQKPNEAFILESAALGNKEAIALIKEKQDFKHQIKTEMLNQHGIDLTQFFEGPAKEDPAKKNPNARGGAIKFKF